MSLLATPGLFGLVVGLSFGCLAWRLNRLALKVARLQDDLRRRGAADQDGPTELDRFLLNAAPGEWIVVDDNGMAVWAGDSMNEAASFRKGFGGGSVFREIELKEQPAAV